MRVDWKNPRVRIAGAVTFVVLVVWSIADGAFTTWGTFDYIGWWVVVPLLVLLFAALITFLVRAWGGKRD